MSAFCKKFEMCDDCWNEAFDKILNNEDLEVEKEEV